MQREIKFRAWDKILRKMFNHEDIKIWNRFMEDDMSNQYAPLMQYTGLKDKNGKEIYEGDIVKIPLSDHDEDDYIFGKIDWNEKYARFEVKEYEPYDNYCFQTEEFDDWNEVNHFEVIGDVYTSPELLKEVANG